VIHALAETVGADAAVGVVRPVTAVVAVGFARPRQAVVTLATFAVLAVLVAGSAALAYRWYFRAEIPEGVTGLLGVAVVALYLNTTSLGSIAAGDSPTLLAPETVFFNVVSLGVAVVMAPVGRYVGDRLAVDVFALSGAKQLEGELSGVVRAVGRFTAVTLPSVGEIGDMDTYDPVSPEKKAELAETTLLFPRKPRWRTSASGSSPGSKRSTAWATSTSTSAPTGRSSTSRSAPALPDWPDARPGIGGDRGGCGSAEQRHRRRHGPAVAGRSRAETRRNRGTTRVAADAVTVALDESDAERLTDEGGYRIVTLPAEPQADREFASPAAERGRDDGIGGRRGGSDLDGSTVGDVDTVVAAVRRPRVPSSRSRRARTRSVPATS